MTQFSDFLAEKLPIQDQGYLSFTDHQPKAFKAWIDALPMINIGESAKLLYHAILELGHLQVVPSHRFQLLEMLRPKIHYITEALKPHYIKNPIVLSTKAKKVANLSQSLQKNLAMNYKICLIETLTSKSKILNGSKICAPSSLHRFISELCFVLLRGYQLYLPAMPNLWLDLHLAFALAENKGFLDFSLEDTVIDNRLPHSIGDMYKKAIILASAQPNQLQPEDLENIFYSSNHWSTAVSITTEALPNSLYGLILNSDVPPRFLRDIQGQHHYVRFVSMENVLTYLKNHNNKPSKTAWVMQNEVHPCQRCFINELILNHLNNTWQSESKRAKERLPKTCRVTALFGFSACYNQLQQAAGHDKQTLDAFQPAEQYNEITLSTPNSIDSKSDNRDCDEPEINTQPEYYHCQTINFNLSGACLAWFNSAPKALSNGALICLKTEDNQDWHIGVVRWVRHFQGEGIRTGIKFFAQNSQAVTLKILHSTNPKYAHPAIALPPTPTGTKPRLLLNANTRASSTRGILQYAGEHEVYLGKVLNQTANFQEIDIETKKELFDISSNEQQPVKTLQKVIANEEDGLDDLWSEL